MDELKINKDEIDEAGKKLFFEIDEHITDYLEELGFSLQERISIHILVVQSLATSVVLRLAAMMKDKLKAYDFFCDSIKTIVMGYEDHDQTK